MCLAALYLTATRRARFLDSNLKSVRYLTLTLIIELLLLLSQLVVSEMLSKPASPAKKASATSRGLNKVGSDPSSPSCEKRRRVSGKSSVVDVWSPHGSLEQRFPGLSGAALIEKIFETYGDPRAEYLDFAWFQEDGRPTVIADPCNRPLQQSTVAEYEQRLFASGLASDCSGPLVAFKNQDFKIISSTFLCCRVFAYSLYICVGVGVIYYQYEHMTVIHGKSRKSSIQIWLRLQHSVLYHLSQPHT